MLENIYGWEIGTLEGTRLGGMPLRVEMGPSEGGYELEDRWIFLHAPAQIFSVHGKKIKRDA